MNLTALGFVLAFSVVDAAFTQTTPHHSAVTAPITNATAGYYRQPCVHGDTLVFVSEGDLWRCPITGGVASRLTTHPGEESHPAISPDGQTLAFLATYEGPSEVYTMPLSGGVPTRRTWGATRTNFVGWSPDEKLLYSTREYATLPTQQMITIDIVTNAVTKVPLYESDQGAFDTDGTLYFTRFPFQGSHTKRYKGGFIQQLWKFKQGDAEATPLTTDYEGTSKEAMVRGGRVYFASDRNGIMNIWSMDTGGKDLKQVTTHDQFDVYSPEMDSNPNGAGRIVYQHGADVWSLDLSNGQSSPVSITLASDFDHLREKWIKSPAGSMSSWAVSPDGSHVTMTSRGRVFVAPAKQGRFVEATNAQGVRYRNAVFSNDGKNLIVLSDQSGEVEFWSVPANGVGEASPITTDADTLRWEGLPSPDGKLLAHHDKKLRLFITNLETKVTTQIATNRTDNFSDLCWSSDSRWLLYVAHADNTNRVAYLHNVAAGTTTPLTTDRFDSVSPRFTPDGQWIYLLSDRNINSTTSSPWGTLAPMPFFDERTRLYAIPLKRDTRSPWQPKDELQKDEKKKDEKKPADPPAEKKAGAADAPKPEAAKDEPKKDEKIIPEVVIELDGIQSRLFEIPVPPGNYGNLRVTDKALFWSSMPTGEDDITIKAVAIGNEKIEVKTVASGGIKGFELSADGKKLAIRKNDTLAVVDAAPAPAELDKNTVDFSAWSMSVTPLTEWRQMYADAWRLLRDYFYANNMHGVDWPAMRTKYAPLVERVRSRGELNDVLAQLTGELSTLHHFVSGGDLRAGSDRIAIGSLGAELVQDQPGNGWRVEHVYKHDPDEPQRCAPLARPGVNVVAGDIITHINGISTLSAPHPSALLRNTSGKQVLLRIKPSQGEERDVIVVPMNAGDAADLRYHEWEYTRRLEVENVSDNQIGYVHLRAMGKGNIAEWAKGFYPVFNRSGLIIDVRRNNGGNIDSWVLTALLRKAWMYWNQHAGRADSWNMQYAFRGHVVVICDAFTASDGEAFSEGFKRLGLGKVIGTRTWGGEVWLSSSNTLSDGGLASAGEYGVFAPDDKGEYHWIVEGRGVEPDIVVDNPPHAAFKGEDPQLQAAIKHLQQLIKDKPITVPPVPTLPDKSKK